MLVVVVRFIAITQILRIQTVVCVCVVFAGKNVLNSTMSRARYSKYIHSQMCKIKHSTLFVPFSLFYSHQAKREQSYRATAEAMAAAAKTFR